RRAVDGSCARHLVRLFARRLGMRRLRRRPCPRGGRDVSAGVPLRRDGRLPGVLHEPPAELDLVGTQLGHDAEVDVRRPRLRRARWRHVRLVVAPLTLAIIGAGPFGLAQAAWAADAGVDYAIIGHPMEFWRDHMPAGMLLRSTAEWHL